MKCPYLQKNRWCGLGLYPGDAVRVPSYSMFGSPNYTGATTIDDKIYLVRVCQKCSENCQYGSFNCGGCGGTFTGAYACCPNCGWRP